MAEESIPSPFDPEKFRTEGHKLVDTLSDYLSNALTGKEMAILPWHEPDSLTDAFSFDSAGGETESFDSFFRRIIENSIHIHNPRYIGHQVTSPLPLTALAHLCTSLLNNGAAIYEMGPVNMAMERNVINKFGSLIGYKTGYDGIFTHGGTAGNLTAMLAARQNMTDYNIWEEGVSENNRPAYMVSSQAHYSVGRNIKIMGLGEKSAIHVPVDSSFRMSTGMLEELKEKAEKEGVKVIAVVASACSTATGSYDDLDKIADFCEKHKLWMHVDGAHGMGVLFSEKYKSLIKGIERADSVVIDFHKMLLVPALNTVVMFKNSDKSYETFAQKASYLFQKSQSNLWYDSAIRTIECTKSALGIIAYTALKYYGSSYYREYIEGRYDLARKFAGMVDSDSRMELAVAPESNIVCFRFIGNDQGDEALNKINLAIRDKIMKEGSFYVVKAELGGKIWIRVTIINPVTSENDLKKLLVRICDVANELN
jgi:L-2,4-diaminobutyrate decarboxylase